jgi:hypothetical protein
MKIKVECPVCGWQGEEGICPRCDFPLEKYRWVLSGSPVVYDESLREEFEIDVQKHKKIYEERTAGGSQGGQKLFPDEETQRRWYTTVVQLAEELNVKVEKVSVSVEEIEKKNKKITEFLEKLRSLHSSVRSKADENFENSEKYQMMELEKYKKEIDSIKEPIPKVKKQVEEVKVLLAQLIEKIKELKEIKKNKFSIGCLAFIILYLSTYFLAKILNSIIGSENLKRLNENTAISMLIVFMVFFIVIILPVLIPILMSKGTKSEINDLNEQIEASIDELENELENYLQNSEIIRKEFISWFDKWNSRVDAIRQEMGLWGGDWKEWRGWEPVSKPMTFLRLGEFVREVKIAGIFSTTVALPALVPFRDVPGIFIPASEDRRVEVIKCLQSLGFRILASVPPGRVRFTFIDPVGLGENVASFLRLKEFDESDKNSFVTSRAWTEPGHINRQLEVIRKYITEVIQEKLKDQYVDIEEYNSKSGEKALPYRVLMVFDFPANFTSEAVQNLLSIAEIGKRAGVFVIVHHDQSRKSANKDEIKALSQILDIKEFRVFNTWRISFDEQPPVKIKNEIIQKWGSMAKNIG